MVELSSIDLDGFADRIDAIGVRIRAAAGPEDLRHLRKIERWGRLCTALGYATAWVFPNPLSALLLSQGRITRWAMVAHHVSHQGYDAVPGVPRGKTSAVFARGWRRYIDWFDWIVPEAWDAEHNRLHHNELVRPVDAKTASHSEWLRSSGLPGVVRAGLVFGLASTWKATFYAPDTLRVLATANDGECRTLGAMYAHPAVWLRSWLPYVLGQFVLIPALFLFVGPWAALFVLLNSLLAEWITNLHSFSMVATNHLGADLTTFTEPVRRGRGEAYVRQVVGSTNFTTGSDGHDFLRGFLNYQIEHHLYPDLSMRQYQRVQPEVKAACEEFGVPYLQEPVTTRLGKTLAVMLGTATERSPTPSPSTP